MRNINWNDVNEANEFPVPGGYAAKIVKVEDVEEKEYLRISWDYAEGKYKGSNQETFDQWGFYPASFIRSYKQKALPFFKAFKTAVEKSNKNYTFNNDPQSLVGKYVGLVLGEEEYLANDGSVKTRLYVDQIHSGEKIRSGDFKIPAMKKLKETENAGTATAPAVPLEQDDDDLPF